MLLMLILGCSSARINGNFDQTAPPTWAAIRDFCRFVDPKHAALAPERGARAAFLLLDCPPQVDILLTRQ